MAAPLTLAAAGLAILASALPAAAAAPHAMPASMPTLGASAPPGAGVRPDAAPAGWVAASAYRAADTTSAQGCQGAPRLRDGHLSVATPLVPCGHRIRVCTTQGRCVIAVRRDSGPYVGGRKIDLNLGVVRALGFRSVYAWGVRQVWWEPLGPAPRVGGPLRDAQRS